MNVIFSWDDGALEDIKLFDLHEKYEIPGMFFIPTRNREGRAVITPDILRKVESKNILFGGHTENHTYLTDIPIEMVEQEIVQNKVYLENELGHKIEHFCLPGGRYNEEILKIVYKYYKTIRTADTMNFKYKKEVLKPTFHFYPRGNKSLLGNALRNKSYLKALNIILDYKSDYFRLITNLVEKEQNVGESIIVIWGHSWEIEKYQLWDKLEKFMQQDCVRNNVTDYQEIFVGKI